MPSLFHVSVKAWGGGGELFQGMGKFDSVSAVIVSVKQH